MPKSIHIPKIKKSDDQKKEQLDFKTVLAGVKELTEWDEWAKKEEIAENQYLIEILTKINNLTDWDLWNKDVASIFQSFWKNFKNSLKSKLTAEQAKNFKNEIEYLINNSTIDDKEIEQQMNNLYTVLWTFIEPTMPAEETEKAADANDLSADTNLEINTKDNIENQNIVNLDDEPIEDINVENEEIIDENNNSDKVEESVTLKSNIDTNNIQEDLINFISNKVFPWKNFIQDIVCEQDQIKKSNNLKLLQLALVPYYEWEIDWKMNWDTLEAIKKYVTKNLSKGGEKISKSDDANIIRCGSDWNLLNEINWLNTVIKKIDNKGLWHAYFIDYQDFEYTIEKSSKITATINDSNYFYDISTNTLQKQTENDTIQEVDNENLLKKYFKTIAIITNK